MCTKSYRFCELDKIVFTVYFSKSEDRLRKYLLWDFFHHPYRVRYCVVHDVVSTCNTKRQWIQIETLLIITKRFCLFIITVYNGQLNTIFELYRTNQPLTTRPFPVIPVSFKASLTPLWSSCNILLCTFQKQAAHVSVKRRHLTLHTKFS